MKKERKLSHLYNSDSLWTQLNDYVRAGEKSLVRSMKVQNKGKLFLSGLP